MIPNRFSEHHFRQFARIIGQALVAFPDAITVECGELTTATTAEYIRRAFKAKEMHGWKHAHVDEGLWVLHGKKIYCQEGVANGKAVVRVGSRDALKKKHKLEMKTDEQKMKQVEIEVTTEDIGLIDLICILQSRRILEPAPIFIVKLIPDAAQHLQNAHLDILVEKTQERGKYKIL